MSNQKETSKNVIKEENHEKYQLCKTAEACVSLTTPLSVLPFHFREAIVVYGATHSKRAVNALHGPCGTYKTIKNWLDKKTLNCKQG